MGLKILNYYSLENAIQSDIKTKTGFIIANERITRSNRVGRYYTVFPNFRSFLHNRKSYPHSHEVLATHSDRKPNSNGRLVFDFDIEHTEIHPDFKKQVERTIRRVVSQMMIDIDPRILEFVWSTSPNKHKFSKHLTVKNLYFELWNRMSHKFYNEFSYHWDRKYPWISSDDLIDKQIIRTNASLRMVGSRKIQGKKLRLDTRHSFTDSLIRIYLKSERHVEQRVRLVNYPVEESVPKPISPKTTRIYEASPTQEPVYTDKIYHLAFELFNQRIQPGVFVIRKLSGAFVNLIRIRSECCILSGTKHDHENAFLQVESASDDGDYNVYFRCYRKCRGRTALIGMIIDDQRYEVSSFWKSGVVDQKFKY